MSYLLDTTHVIDQLRDEPDVVELLVTLSPAGIATSIITYLEAFQGTLRPNRPVQRAKFDAFFAAIPLLPLSPAIAQRCARLREDLKR